MDDTLVDSRLAPAELVGMGGACLLVLVATYRGLWPVTPAEAWGFVTGGVCVWLVVREHVWNWPVGLANDAFFFVLFLRGRLFADMSLQLVYFAIGVYGWLNWRRGGERGVLAISRTTRAEWLALAALLPLATLLLRQALVAVHGAAPFWDSLTTVLSLAAQYLLARKRLENWLFWIAADLVYVPLYCWRQLPLTALLYLVFLVLCLLGVRAWWRSFALVARP